MKTILKRYRAFIIVSIAILVFTIFNFELGMKALNITAYSFKEMVLVIPPIFVLLGLLDIWVPREIMIKYMGEGSGLKGILLSIFIGSAAAGPLYGAFPVAAVFMKKGVKFSNILIFIGAWSTTKIPISGISGHEICRNQITYRHSGRYYHSSYFIGYGFQG